MKKIKKYKNEKVYCLEHGDGELRGVIKLFDGIEDYFKVKFIKDDLVKYYPIKGDDQVRIISSLSDLNAALVDLGNKLNDVDFMFEYKVYQRNMLNLDVHFVVNIIASLSTKKKLIDCDKLILRQCLRSLVLEVSHVFEVNENSAKAIVSEHMRCA